MMKIQFDIDPKRFQDELTERITNDSGHFTMDIIGNIVSEQFKEYLNKLISSGDIHGYELTHDLLGRDSHSLRELYNKKLLNVHFFKVKLITDLKDLREFQLISPKILQWMDDFRIWKQEDTTTVRSVTITFWSVGLPAKLLAPVVRVYRGDCKCQLNLLIPQAFDWSDDYPQEIEVDHRISKYGNGINNMSWVLRYFCRICGKTYFCECFRNALRIFYRDVLSLPKKNEEEYEEGYWPLKFITLYRKTTFRKDLCHLCRDIPSNWIGRIVEPHKFSTLYYPYIIRTAYEKNIYECDAENEIRDLLGYPRIGEGWISEVHLLKIVRDIFPDVDVTHQASLKWLGRQRIDIYIPSLKVAIEYQGLQHYEPVEFFGGEEGFKKVQVNDKRKAALCAENGISLIYFRFDESITHDLVEERIRKALVKICNSKIS